MVGAFPFQMPLSCRLAAGRAITKVAYLIFLITVCFIKQMRILAVGVADIWFRAQTENLLLVVKLVQQSIFITLVFALL